MTIRSLRNILAPAMVLGLAVLLAGCGADEQMAGPWVSDRDRNTAPVVITFATDGTFTWTVPGRETARGSWKRSGKTVSLELANGACAGELDARDGQQGLVIRTCSAPGLQADPPTYFLPGKLLSGEPQMRLSCDIRGASAQGVEVRTLPGAPYTCFDYAGGSCGLYLNAGVIVNHAITWFQRESQGEFRYEIMKGEDGQRFEIRRSECLPSSAPGTCVTTQYRQIGSCTNKNVP